MRRGAARLLSVAAVAACYLASGLSGARSSPAAHDGRPPLLLEGTVVTMDAKHRVIHVGRVLVRGGRIAAVWSGSRIPPGISVRGARVVDAGRGGLIFPGLIDIHDHPAEDFEPLFAPPSSDRQPQFGRPTGHEPYDYRYEWNTAPLSAQYQRLVVNPQVIGTDLGLEPQIIVHDEARAALAGEVAIQGEPEVTSQPGVNGLLVRDIGGSNFGADRVASRVASVQAPGFASSDAPALRTQMASGSIDAWIVHVAEGVRDSARAPGDGYSSRREFATIRALGLLNDATVIVHGTALEPADFAAMRHAGPAVPGRRTTGSAQSSPGRRCRTCCCTGTRRTSTTRWPPV